MIALDASALLGFMFDEPGCADLGPRLQSACMSAVNACEVLGRFARDGHPTLGVLERMLGAGIEIVPFDCEAAAIFADLYPSTAPLGLSLGDRACLGLALARGIVAVTADRKWAELEIGVTVEVVR